jgi:predicted acylesterase/phospholipase RssA/CRP-like cAMP-binding protein
MIPLSMDVATLPALALTRKLLAASSLFGHLTGEALDAIAREMELQHLPGGELLFSANDPGDCMYLLIHGRLRVYLHNAGDVSHADPLGEVSPGETVGEMALITGELRSATVCAVRDTSLLRLSKHGFEQLTERYPRVMLALTRQIVLRLSSMLDADKQAALFSTLVLVPLDDRVPMAGFSEQLSAALGAFGATQCVSRERIDARLGAGTADSPAEAQGNKPIAAWLDEQETRCDYLLMIADCRMTEWTHRCLRHADRVLYVGNAAANGVVSNPVEAYLDAHKHQFSQPVRELVLLQPENAQPGSAHDWLQHYQVYRHHHLRCGSTHDAARLARQLTGNATALVLSGGGARGFAHLGVLRALAESNVEIDTLGGASMGAIIAAQAATGMAIEDIIAAVRRGFIKEGSMKNFTLPLISLLSGRNGFRVLKSLCGDRLIENLSSSFFCVSTNLSRAEVVVHRRGPLLDAIIATIAVPGILPPVFRGGDVLVDGGVLNNLPVDIMRRYHQGTVIASEVSADDQMIAAGGYDKCPSAGRYLRDRLSPTNKRGRVPSIFDILLRSATIGSTRASGLVKSDVDLMIQCPTGAYGMTEWKAFDALVEIGYRSASEALENRDRGQS